MWSVLIPTWNNLALLKQCLTYLEKYTQFPYEVILHVNEGTDGTLEWVQEQGIVHTHSTENIGICQAINQIAERANYPYLVYLNDDMVCLPQWDVELQRCIQSLDTEAFMISGTMIEPVASGNACAIVADYGRDPASFRAQDLIRDLPRLVIPDWYGATWPPTVVHQNWWKKVGGYSLEFSPGMSSDNDFSMKMWQAGCRIFLGVGTARVYHFMSRSTGKVKKNDGRRQFLKKWGMTQSTFDRHFLRRGSPVTTLRLPEPSPTPRYFLDRARSWLKSLG